MRDRRLHTALRAFAEEAAWTLGAETAAGAELPFEVLEEGGRSGPTLYCYRADTAGFIADRTRMLRELETWLPAVQALSDGAALEAYLRSRGASRLPAGARERAEAALRFFLERLFEDRTEFVLDEERFANAYAELEELVTASRTDVEVVVPLLGVSLESEEVALAPGLSLARPSAVERAPEAAAWDGENEAVLFVVRGEDETVAPSAAAHARRLVTALRLYDATAVALAPTAWIRTAGGPWQVVSTGAAGRPEGELHVPAEAEDELRAFCSLVWRRMPRGGELAWALARFEMGCERPSAHRLTDHLLALHALLDAGDSRLPERVAALVAEPDGRAAVADRVAHAVSLERAVVAGHGIGGGADALAAELAGYLRAILRDVLCGHLDSDLRRLADELLESEPAAAHTAAAG